MAEVYQCILETSPEDVWLELFDLNEQRVCLEIKGHRISLKAHLTCPTGVVLQPVNSFELSLLIFIYVLSSSMSGRKWRDGLSIISICSC